MIWQSPELVLAHRSGMTMAGHGLFQTSNEVTKMEVLGLDLLFCMYHFYGIN